MNLSKIVLKELSDLGAYIYHKAVTSDSVYIKFSNPKLGSLRISDHEGRSKYSYRWNLRSDLESYVDKYQGRYYYNTGDIRNMIKHIRNYERCIT